MNGQTQFVCSQLHQIYGIYSMQVHNLCMVREDTEPTPAEPWTIDLHSDYEILHSRQSASVKAEWIDGSKSRKLEEKIF